VLPQHNNFFFYKGFYIMTQGQLIIALDVNTLDAARSIIHETREFCGIYKVGLELFSAYGPNAVSVVEQASAQVFLDLKLHDIPHTVAAAIKEAMQYNIRFLTVHALGGPAMLKAAAEESITQSGDLQLLAVSVLTHHNDAELKTIGFHQSSTELVLTFLQNAYQSGIRGCVCSPLEAAAVRANFGADMTIVCPGVRLNVSATNDQCRIATPNVAIQNGADYIVVGRPITKAPNMKQAAALVLREIQEGFYAKK
jgi:orotidine-5'-phosphate decarboxylase